MKISSGLASFIFLANFLIVIIPLLSHQDYLIYTLYIFEFILLQLCLILIYGLTYEDSHLQQVAPSIQVT